MLNFIYRLIREFEREHGIHPNLLYLSPVHAQHLKDSVDESYTMQSIRNLLHMELIVNQDIVHPHVAWAQCAQRVAV